MNWEGSMERLRQAAQETLPVEQPVKNMEVPPAFGRQEAGEGTADMPPKVERSGTPEEMALGRTCGSSRLREVYRPETPKDTRLMTPQERAKAAFAQMESGRPRPKGGMVD